MGDLESTDGDIGMLPSTLAEENNNTEREVANDDAYQVDGDGTFWNTDSQGNVVNGM